jgi:hypothetical protein
MLAFRQASWELLGKLGDTYPIPSNGIAHYSQYTAGGQHFGGLVPSLPSARSRGVSPSYSTRMVNCTESSSRPVSWSKRTKRRTVSPSSSARNRKTWVPLPSALGFRSS